jgi:4-hydroxy-3-methylbut-2-enyl diphosphate reductase
MEVVQAKPSKKKYFESELVAYLSASGEPMRSDGGRIAVYVAHYYGFCHGVVRAIRLALDASEKYADRRLFLLGQMIHNPYVNRQLQQRGVTILEIPWDDALAGIGRDAVVIIPAFGVSVDTMRRLAEIGCTVVDTTCGEVMSVWKRIGRYNTSDFTTIIHGKYAHEESMATSSRARRYLVVKDLKEAGLIANYIRSGDPAQAQAILARFAGAYSAGFDPARDLQHVGMAAQTTMYANEFLQVSGIIHDAVADRYGEQAGDHFQELDTICSATQERQDSIDSLAQRSDVVVVVGGYNSSNTTNLTHVAQMYAPAYHIQGQGQITRTAIRHQPYGKREEEITTGWLPDKPTIAVGLTSGASTPDNILDAVLHEILALDPAPEEAAP